MHRGQRFRSFKKRGEWVELKFMAEAAARGFSITKPWGDCSPYDVGIDHNGGMIRVQVKSTSYRVGAGYLCRFKPSHPYKHDYSLDRVDIFAAYIVPEGAWYIIPAAVLLGPKRRGGLMLCPVEGGRNHCKYERYREAWGLLGKSRDELKCYR
jgi:hypothetical protein